MNTLMNFEVDMRVFNQGAFRKESMIQWDFICANPGRTGKISSINAELTGQLAGLENKE